MRTIQRPFPGARPRPDRLRARDPGADLERALLAQDAQGPDRVRGPDDRQPAQADDLRRDPGDLDLRLAGQRLLRQRRRGPVRRRARRLLQGRDPQPSLGDRPLRRLEHGPRRRDPRCPGHRPGRQADLQHRRLLRGAARPSARPASRRRAPPQARAQGGRRGRARLRQPDGHSDGQRGPGRRPGLPRQSPGLLRHRRRSAAGQGVQEGRAGRPDRRHRRPHRPRRHPRRDLQLGRADRRERVALRRRRADRQRDHREDGARRDPPGPRPRALPCDHRLRRRRASARRSARWAPSSGPRSTSIVPRSSTRGSPTPRSGSPRPRNGWSWPCRREKWPALQALCAARARRGHRPGPSSFPPAGSRSAITGRSWATCRWTSCTRAGPTVVREATSFTPPEERPLELPDSSRLHRRSSRPAAALGRLQQGVDRPPVRPRGAGAGP